MGIKDLNRYFRENTVNAIKIKQFDILKNKLVAVDISIYMYKFLSDGLLIENIYLMLLLFKEYDVQPIFIFDGKPPIEKYTLLKKRREEKKEAEEEYNKLILSRETTKINYINSLKKKFIHIAKTDLDLIKKLISAFGFVFYEALNEADEICAALCIKNKVWGCISEDMDMFVYGCSNVIRYISLLNHTCVHYNLALILKELNITQETLSKICILTGTDYNIDTPFTRLNLYEIFNYYKQHKSIDDLITDNVNFYKIYEIFKTNVNIDNITIKKSNISYQDIKNNTDVIEILKTNGFIFPTKQ
jgi:flap endonuclease-1